MSEQPTRPQPERRRYRRVSLTTPVIVIRSAEIRTYSTRDLSPGGAFLFANDAPPVGSAVRIEFVLARNKRFSMPATVIRDETNRPAHEQPGFAISFDISPGAREEIGCAVYVEDGSK